MFCICISYFAHACYLRACITFGMHGFHYFRYARACHCNPRALHPHGATRNTQVDEEFERRGGTELAPMRCGATTPTPC